MHNLEFQNNLTLLEISSKKKDAYVTAVMIEWDGHTYSLMQIKTSVKTFLFSEEHHNMPLENIENESDKGTKAVL